MTMNLHHNKLYKYLHLSLCAAFFLTTSCFRYCRLFSLQTFRSNKHKWTLLENWTTQARKTEWLN